MIKKLLAAAVMHLFNKPVQHGRASVRDVAFPFRMGAGYAGDVNRTHPAGIEPTLGSTANPPTAYGQCVVPDAAQANSMRPLAAGDTALTYVYGLTARPYPTQPTSGGPTAAFGGGVPPTGTVIDVMRSGYMSVQCNAGAVPVKGGAVYVWVAATSGVHIQGQYESAATGGSTVALDPARYQFNGPADSSNVTEIYVR